MRYPIIVIASALQILPALAETWTLESDARAVVASAAAQTPVLATVGTDESDYEVFVAYGQTNTIDAAFVSAIGSKDLVKTGRGTLASSNVMSNYTGTITVREGAFLVRTTADLGTGDGGTVVEDGGTLVVKMKDVQERFREEQFTIAGTGDAAYGAAIYQPTSNDRFKLFKNLALSGDATIYAGTRLGVDAGTLAMNGHTLTVKGANFTFRNISTSVPVGDLVAEARLVFAEGGSGSIGSSTRTLTAQNGGILSFGEATQTILWRIVVGNGGSIDSYEAGTSLALESDELSVQANPATGVLSVRDKRTGREWQTLAPASIGVPSFANAPRFTLSGAELVVEADFAELTDTGTVFPAPLAPNQGDALVIPMSEGFRIPFDECDLLKGVELEAWHGSHLSMPFFGVVDAADECGFMVILETPEDAKIKCFADASDFGVGAVATLWMPECGSPGYTRRARFVFFDAGGYVAMAKRYRTYAAAQGLVKTFAEKAAERPLVERLPGAANIWYFPGSGDPTHAAVAAELREAGIVRFLWSWNSSPRPSDLAAISAMTNTLAGRYDVCRDVYYPDLLDALGRENPPSSEVGLNTSAWPGDIMWNSADSNDWRRGWTVTGTNGATYHCAVQCDIPAVERTRRISGNDLTNNPYTARLIDVTAAKGWEECYNPAHPMTRRVSRDAKIELFRMLGDEFGIVVGSEQGMDAFVPVCDYFEGMLSPSAARMPSRRDGYGRSARFRDDGDVPAALTENERDKMERYAMNERYRIPLFELVYHGCVASHWYWFDYSNSPVCYWWKRDVFNALYGTAPMYIFDYQLWRERKAEFVASWNRVGGIARQTGFSEMLSHRALTADRSVQETRFADGTVVTADFNLGTIDTAPHTRTVIVPEGQTLTIDADFVSALGTNDLVKAGRGVLVSTNLMSNYTGTITVREGALLVKTTADFGTADGGTVVEDGGTLVVNMAAKDQSFGGEVFTIAGTGDATYGAAIYQATGKNDQNKLFKNIVLSDDATIFSGTYLGMASGSLTMNGHALTIKGNGSFTFRAMQTPAPVGNLVMENKSVRFRGGSNATGDASKALTVQGGSTLVLGYSDDNVPPIWWKLVVEEGGKVMAEASQGRTYYGDVEWNSTVADGVSGPLVFNGEVTGTGVIKSSGGTLTFAKPLGENVGLGLSGTATALLPPAKSYSYQHKGLITCYRSDASGDNRGKLNNANTTDNTWGYCAYGPGPQLEREGWWPAANGRKDLWNARGYLWNREVTNVTYTIRCGCVYQNWVNTGGTLAMNSQGNWIFSGDRVARYDGGAKRDSWKTFSIEVPANSCIGIDIQTMDGGNNDADDYGGPRTNSDKFMINGVVARDEAGWFFTTNNVSGPEGLSPLPTLSLGNGGVLDANNMPLTVSNLVGGAVVTNVTTLTVSGLWTLTAADIVNDTSLVVDGTLAFGDGCRLSVEDVRNLPSGRTYTVCTADSIVGFPADKAQTRSVDGSKMWQFKLSGDGKSISLVKIPFAMCLKLR